MSAEDREKHLFYALNSGGLYHSFLERLKPRVQRIVRKRFVGSPKRSFIDKEKRFLHCETILRYN